MAVIEGESRRLLDIIQTQGEIAAGDLDQDRAMQLIVHRVPALIGADGALIDSPVGDRLVFRAGSGVEERVIGLEYPRADSLSGRALERREVLISSDTKLDPRVEAEACRKLGARSLLCAPLLHRDEELGSLTAFSALPHAFDEGDREAIDLIGRSLSAHLHHAAGFSLASHQSRHDHLTGLQNRRAYESRLEQETSKAARTDDDLALCLLDLDRFKAVNDHFGHVVGDDVLRAVARGFRNCRLHDEAFRIGGDEFAVVFPGGDERAARTAIRRMVDELDLTDLTRRGVRFGVSFGIAAGKTDPRALHAAADTELTAAKRLGRRPRRAPDPVLSGDGRVRLSA
ncbi:MAG: GGDEF domain-containing protein [Actinobacteria bacterium]|nr:GGDEF domain-containing protein [Actinomycetota bacterium]